MSAMLAVDGVSVRYGEVWGAREVSFDVEAGEVLGIVGESGSGKSTILACAALERPPTSGRVRLRGEDVSGVAGAARRKLRAEAIGVVEQAGAKTLDPSVSAGGTIAERMFSAGYRSFGAVRERALALYEAMELPRERFDAPVGTFSGGMRQRVRLARALATAPPLLLLDEPTTGLDVSVQARILDLLRRVQRERNLATVIVSHDLGVIRALADRVLVMRSGEIVERGLTDRVLGDPQHPYTQLLVSAQLA